MSLSLFPIPLDEANAFVAQHHRHHQPVVGHKYSIGCESDGDVVGVAIVGRPVARGLDDGRTLEVTRCCTDGTKTACSMLYGAEWRAAKAMGYRRMVTYVLASESGGSVAASGWEEVFSSPGGSWSTPSRPRVDKHPLQKKLRFEVTA